MARLLFHAQVASCDTLLLDEREAHHVTRVLRLTPGTVVRLFDGQGTVAEARIATIDKRTAQVEVLRRWQQPPPRPAVVVCSAVPKGERLRWMVEKLTELGATALVPLNTKRSVVAPRTTKWDRMRQVSIEACKQSGNPHALRICPESPLAEAINAGGQAGAPERSSGERLLLLCQPGESAEPLAARLRALEAEPGKDRPALSPREVRLLIGPEGGFTEQEVDTAMAAGACAVTLGGTILRIETAAVAATAMVRLWFAGRHDPSTP